MAYRQVSIAGPVTTFVGIDKLDSISEIECVLCVVCSFFFLRIKEQEKKKDIVGPGRRERDCEMTGLP